MTAPKHVVFVGERFSFLEVLGEAERKCGRRRVRVRCDCGNETEVFAKSLPTGNTKSCGCQAVALRILARELEEKRPLIPLQTIFVPTARLLGRAIIALSEGPRTMEELAGDVGVELEELLERQEVLRGHVHAIRLEHTDLAFLRTESCERLWLERGRVLGTLERLQEAA